MHLSIYTRLCKCFLRTTTYKVWRGQRRRRCNKNFLKRAREDDYRHRNISSNSGPDEGRGGGCWVAGAAVIIQLIQRRQPPPSERRSKGEKKTRFRRWRRAVNFYLDCNMSMAKCNDEFFFFLMFSSPRPLLTLKHTYTYTDEQTNAYTLLVTRVYAYRICLLIVVF